MYLEMANNITKDIMALPRLLIQNGSLKKTKQNGRSLAVIH